ncbi:hypothetical protein BX283_5497 [Streptomyces sp. TLI_146]|nr:hypothetical protein BX283_5497 [Streptomyces sp. TLI_146]
MVHLSLRVLGVDQKWSWPRKPETPTRTACTAGAATVSASRKPNALHIKKSAHRS